MIVVVIIGILAAIAIPQFNRYQLRSKAAEGPTVLGAIKLGQEAFAAKYGLYVLAEPHPPGAGGPQKRVWTTTTDGLALLGYKPNGTVYYSYYVSETQGTPGGTSSTMDSTTGAVLDAVTITLNAVDIYIHAAGNIDGDPVSGYFFVTDEAADVRGNPASFGELVF